MARLVGGKRTVRGNIQRGRTGARDQSGSLPDLTRIVFQSQGDSIKEGLQMNDRTEYTTSRMKEKIHKHAET
jgi:hypothetical protein